ncbi:MAG: helix-turn-helix domain-containing protein [Planctomycetes bacterium]|nr:helix-turn-helix domain-containing protein [Planctomycetota bacterium]
MTPYSPEQLDPPGEIIREELEARGWTQTDLAEVMDRPLAAVNEIINGKRKITPKSAQELATALEVDARFWMNLESAYQLSLSTGSRTSSERAKMMNYAPVKELQNRGWLPDAPDTSKVLDAMMSFFGITTLDERPVLSAAFRQSSDAIDNSHLAWCIFAMQKARAQRVNTFHVSRAGKLRESLRTLAAHKEEIRRVPSVLSDFGIRFVIVKHLRSTKIDGATLWLDGQKRSRPVIAMSLRRGRIDNFWFTLCHELSHVLNRDSFRLDEDLAQATAGSSADEIEERASEEAASMLIPAHEIQSFILRKRPYFSAKSIIQFANKIQIHPGIVVGQLQYRNAIKYSHSSHMLVAVRDLITETAVSDGWIK